MSERFEKSDLVETPLGQGKVVFESRHRVVVALETGKREFHHRDVRLVQKQPPNTHAPNPAIALTASVPAPRSFIAASDLHSRLVAAQRNIEEAKSRLTPLLALQSQDQTDWTAILGAVTPAPTNLQPYAEILADTQQRLNTMLVELDRLPSAAQLPPPDWKNVEIRFFCPSCGLPCLARDQHLGHTVKCGNPNCRRQLHIGLYTPELLGGICDAVRTVSTTVDSSVHSLHAEATVIVGAAEESTRLFGQSLLRMYQDFTKALDDLTAASKGALAKRDALSREKSESIAEAQSKLSIFSDTVTQLTASLQGVERGVMRDIATLEDQIRGMAEDHAAAIRHIQMQHEQEVSVLNGRITEAHEKAVFWKAEYDKLYGERIPQLERDLKEKDRRIRELEATVDNQQDQIDDLNGVIAAKDEQIRDLKEQLAEAKLAKKPTFTVTPIEPRPDGSSKHWDFLRRYDDPEVKKYLTRVASAAKVRGWAVDYERFTQIATLPYTDVLIPKKRLEQVLDPNKHWFGYCAFLFRGTNKAALACAVEGNAVYIVGRNWDRLLGKLKQEVRMEEDFQRVFLRANRATGEKLYDTWLERISLHLGL